MEETLNKIKSKVTKGEGISPFLVTGKNLEIINQKIIDLSKLILKEYEIPEVYLYIFKDNGENIKVSDLKSFFEPANSKVPYKFQIFFIENISRLTLASSNSLLKLLEEPGNQNLIFLSNFSETNVIDTILSRVQIVYLSSVARENKNEYYQNILKNYINSNNNEVVSYFYKNKLEKEDYLEFLENLLIYAKDNLCFIDMLEEISDDINAIKQNNLNAKYITDKWLLKIK